MISEKLFEIENVPSDLRYGNEDGQFFIYLYKTQKLTSSHYCREIFGGYFGEGTVHVGFVCPKLNIEKLNEFFCKIEDELNIKNDERLVFHGVRGHNNMVIVTMNDFWRQTKNTRAFFTLFLRCGAVYFKGSRSFNGALESYNLSSQIIPAIKSFLKGNIINVKEEKNSFDGQAAGIINMFHGMDEKAIESCLLSKIKTQKFEDIWEPQNREAVSLEQIFNK